MLRFTPCACGVEYLVRLNRASWMRLIPTRRHYFCAKCKDTQFLPRRAFVSWWLPDAPPTTVLPEEGSGRDPARTGGGALGTRTRASKGVGS